MTSFQTQPGAEGTSLYLDGKNIMPRARFDMKRDDLIRFDAYGLQVGASVYLEAKKNGIRFYEKSFPANERGEVKVILFFPNTRALLKCRAAYTTRNGKQKQVKFTLDSVGRKENHKQGKKTSLY